MRELPLKQIWSMKVNNYQRIFQSCISSQSLSLPFPLLYHWCFLLTFWEFSLFQRELLLEGQAVTKQEKWKKKKKQQQKRFQTTARSASLMHTQKWYLVITNCFGNNVLNRFVGILILCATLGYSGNVWKGINACPRLKKKNDHLVEKYFCNILDHDAGMTLLFNSIKYE